MNEVQEKKYADRVAGNIRGFLDATNAAEYSAEYIAYFMLSAMGQLSLPVDLVWQMACAPFLGGPDGWAARNRDAFWDVLERMECPSHPGIVHAPHADCDNQDCLTQGCPEHPRHNGSDHTYEQHHSPEDHIGSGLCCCTAYAHASHTEGS